jgi:hypothetical protein
VLDASTDTAVIVGVGDKYRHSVTRFECTPTGDLSLSRSWGR